MKTKKPLNEANDAIKKSVPVKTLSLQVAITGPDLAKTVREAFDLAKSGGRELDLAFTLRPLAQSFPKPSSIRAV